MFQLPRDYELLEKVLALEVGAMVVKSNILKQFTAYQLLDQNPNFTNIMQDLTDFYTGEKTKTDFSQPEANQASKVIVQPTVMQFGGSSMTSGVTGVFRLLQDMILKIKYLNLQKILITVSTNS
jgi:hypothetical protein